ncbi:MAG: hypothetical protein K5751_09495 [Treponemataceae bacterium]|nr:hypothetical protein [Treponemataceae bacterium]
MITAFIQEVKKEKTGDPAASYRRAFRTSPSNAAHSGGYLRTCSCADIRPN